MVNTRKRHIVDEDADDYDRTNDSKSDEITIDICISKDLYERIYEIQQANKEANENDIKENICEFDKKYNLIPFENHQDDNGDVKDMLMINALLISITLYLQVQFDLTIWATNNINVLEI